MNIQVSANEVIAFEHAILHYYHFLDYLRHKGKGLSDIQGEIEKLLQSFQARLQSSLPPGEQEILDSWKQT
ncbi:hypothetical protein [Ktedonosporobacter rubrisoli]|nr:hypothetical protein [Ktedonosporobacter rubrisoli]